MDKNKRVFKILSIPVVLILLGVLLILLRFDSKKQFTADNVYHAVVLTNGHLYFGKLDRMGKKDPVLRDVYYVQTKTDEKTQKVFNVLIKRGNEWHGPDEMVLNGNHIVFIETVGRDSMVARLIEQDKRSSGNKKTENRLDPGK